MTVTISLVYCRGTTQPEPSGCKQCKLGRARGSAGKDTAHVMVSQVSIVMGQARWA